MATHSANQSSNIIDTFLRNDDFQLVKTMPSDPESYKKEIRFNMNYCQANRLNQSAKW